MRYIGSKLRLVDFIENTIKKYCGENLSDKIFCDLFAGTGVVGRTFSPMVKKVIANDLEKYSFIANYVQLKGYDENIVNSFFEDYKKLPDSEKIRLYDLNRNLKNAYVEFGSKDRLFFSENNGFYLQSVRNYLTERQQSIDFNEYFAALYSIMEGADKVANTMSTYGMYAKKLKENAKKPINFVLPKKAKNAGDQNEVYMADSNKLIENISGDILYLDPPYNARQYSSYYFVLNAIAENLAPETDTKSGVKKEECNKSLYNRKKEVANALEDLIKKADFEWVFLSYNNEGLLSFQEIESIFKKYGEYHVECTGYQRYKADNNRNQKADSTVEYIHVLHKGVFTQEETKESKTCGITIKKIKINPSENREIELNAEVNGVIVETALIKLGIQDKNGRLYTQEALENAVEEFKKTVDNGILGELTNKGGYLKYCKCGEITSPMNYMGGKKKLLKILLPCFPLTENFVDLFCGGATVGINSNSTNVWFNDSIKPLIEMYKYMCETPISEILQYIDTTIQHWELTQENEDAYYNFRQKYNDTPVEERHPLDLFVLMAYSFNNQIRFNEKKMNFNIPFGKNRSSFNNKMRENLIGFVEALKYKNCHFTAGDYKDFDFSSLPPKDTFVYADPPYLVSTATYNSGWSEKDEYELLEYLDNLDKLGYKFALSNVLENKGSKNTILENWISKNNYNVIHIEKSYANSYYQRKEKESKTDEVLITNHETPVFV